MTEEITERISQEIKADTQTGSKYAEKAKIALGETSQEVAESIFGRVGYYRTESGRWATTYDPRFGGKPSLLQILKSR